MEVTTRLIKILQDIARNHEYLCKEIDVKPILTGGANYTSSLFVTTLSAPGKEDLHLFCKVAVLGEKMRSISSLSLFETEIRFYTRILHKYRELEQMYKIPEEERLILPKYYGGSSECMPELLVLEDLSAKGYQTMQRFDVFDWEYASRSVSALARFHALSVAFEKDDPVAYSHMVDDLKLNFPMNEDYLKKGLLTAVNATDEEFRERVEKFLREDLKNQIFRKFWSSEQRRLVLSHTDFRASNILYKVNENGNLNIAIVDHQVIRRGNPVADLLFFLICGSDEQFRADHLHQFFDHYYEIFSRALQRLNIDPQEVYLEKDYRDDVQQMLSYGLTLGVYCLPFITVEVENIPKPQDCVDVDVFDLQVGDRFRDRFNGLVRTYAKLGII